MDDQTRLIVEAACTRLAYQFCHFSDHGRHEDYAALFAPDGRFARPGLEAEGREAILNAIRARPAHFRTRHLCTNVLVEPVDAERATGTGTQLYVLHDTSNGTTHPPVTVDFTDRYVRTSEGWKIASRSVTPAF